MESRDICGIVLAAGVSQRMGRDKALLPWPPDEGSPPGFTLLEAVVAALRPVTGTVLVVVGRNGAALAPLAAGSGAELVVNDAPERGQFSSLRLGLAAARARGFAAAMIAPVDCPPLLPASMMKLLAALGPALAHGYWAVAPEHAGRHGHPLLADRTLIDAFLSAPLSSNARTVLHTRPGAVEYIPVPDAGVGIDLDTPQEYQQAAAGGTDGR